MNHGKFIEQISVEFYWEAVSPSDDDYHLSDASDNDKLK